MTSVIAHPPSPTRSPLGLASPREDENHTNEITPACLASSQAEKVIVVLSLSEMRDKFTQRNQNAAYRNNGRHAARPAVTLGSCRPIGPARPRPAHGPWRARPAEAA